MKFDVFSLNQVQNFRTMLQVAKSYGINTIDGLLLFMENYIAQEARKVSDRGNREYSIGQQGKAIRDTKIAQSIARERKENQKLMNSLPKCPHCENGKLMIITASGLGERLQLEICVFFETERLQHKVKHGCGHSKMVE